MYLTILTRTVSLFAFLQALPFYSVAGYITTRCLNPVHNMNQKSTEESNQQQGLRIKF